jgi:hypothetical protein
LDARFDELLERSGVARASYQRQTRRLLDQLDADAQARGEVPDAA